MVRIAFTANLRRHLPCPVLQAEGETVAEALAAAFAGNPRLRGYVLDDQSRLRRHVVLYLNGRQAKLEAPLAEGDEIYVMQALSGG
ncbi:MAG TPA: MoaD/ThiS family protein [Verrucomicrobiae bacterium]|jgi:molybdopterin converting factor small subunit|nr:MoaD/ThiS family protein [Verrucomicrobiae bacterium]